VYTAPEKRNTYFFKRLEHVQKEVGKHLGLTSEHSNATTTQFNNITSGWPSFKQF